MALTEGNQNSREMAVARLSSPALIEWITLAQSALFRFEKNHVIGHAIHETRTDGERLAIQRVEYDLLARRILLVRDYSVHSTRT